MSCIRMTTFDAFGWASLAVFVLSLQVLGEGAVQGGQCDREAGLCARAPPSLTAVPPTKVGHVEEVVVDSGRTVTRKTLSMKPALFEIEDFLTSDECEHLKDLAQKTGLKPSETYNNDASGMFDRPVQVLDIDSNKKLDINEMRLTLENSYDIYFDDEDVLKMYKDLKLDSNKDGFLTPPELGQVEPRAISAWLAKYTSKYPTTRSRHSSQVWLFLDEIEDKVVKGIQHRVHLLTGLHPNIVAHSDVQVVRYPVSGHYHAHFDSAPIEPKPCCSKSVKIACRICRYMTIMFYLNDVEEGGGTAFPVADNTTIDMNKLRKEHLINLHEHCYDSNLVVLPVKGKAVMWYNHGTNPETLWMGPMDDHAWHGGCPVKRGEKWIANFWIKTTENRDADIERMNLL